MEIREGPCGVGEDEPLAHAHQTSGSTFVVCHGLGSLKSVRRTQGASAGVHCGDRERCRLAAGGEGAAVGDAGDRIP